MVTKIKASLQKVIGSIKENMDTILLGIGGIGLTVGIPIMATSQNESVKIFGLLFAFVGIVCTWISIGMTRNKEYRERKLKHFDMGATLGIYDELQKINSNLTNILDEIRQDRNERKKNNP